MSAPPILTELKLSADMKKAVDTAFESLKPIVVSYVDESGAPQLSFAVAPRRTATRSLRSGSATRRGGFSSRSRRIPRWH